MVKSGYANRYRSKSNRTKARRPGEKTLTQYFFAAREHPSMERSHQSIHTAQPIPGFGLPALFSY
jgi:hypothetical protein